MKQFENYMPDAWQVEGLTVPLYNSSRAPKAPKHAASTKAAVVAFAFSAGVFLFSFNVPISAVTTGGITGRYSYMQHRYGRGNTSEVFDGYWAQLVSVLRNAPVLPEEPENEPEPLV